MDKSNQFVISSSFYKIMTTTCSLKQPMKAMPCIVCFLVPSLRVTTYQVMDIWLVVKSELHKKTFINRVLFSEY